MISIISMGNRYNNECSKNKKYIEFIDETVYNSSKNLFKIGEYPEIEKIIREVEGGEPISEGMFKSKFNESPLGYDALSSGSKVIIGIYNLIKTDRFQDKVIDITDCGFNAIRYIIDNYSDYDLTLYLGHMNLSPDFTAKEAFLLDGVAVNKFFGE